MLLNIKQQLFAAGVSFSLVNSAGTASEDGTGLRLATVNSNVSMINIGVWMEILESVKNCGIWASCGNYYLSNWGNQSLLASTLNGKKWSGNTKKITYGVDKSRAKKIVLQNFFEKNDYVVFNSFFGNRMKLYGYKNHDIQIFTSSFT